MAATETENQAARREIAEALEGAERAIESAGITRGMFRKLHVTVSMEQRCMNEVLFIGAVEEPGIHELPRNNSSLVVGLATAVLTEEASGEIEIRRRPSHRGPPGSPPMPGMAGRDGANPDGTELASYVVPEPETNAAPTIIRVNLAKAAAEGNGDIGRYLQDGDEVIVFKRVPKPVYVTGLVRKPGEYELSANKDMYLLDLMALAGERSIPLADKVMIIRRIPGEATPIRIKVSIREAQADDASNVLLMQGDNVHFADTPATVVMRTLTDVLRIGVGSSIPFF
ncbi:hypothetical protein LCGC14_3121020 [marine sediment metagenome]|uniref:Soluble ligand binding domain-containing protein n=1 Tax=marine sediment metagenome TaxID=412755 RepID=A0A0F8Y9Q3_9ZZZZ